MKNNYAQGLSVATTYAILGVLVGVLLIAIPTGFLLSLVFVLMGIMTVIFNLPPFLGALAKNDEPGNRSTLILSSISLAIGILLIFWHTSLLMIVLGVYMIAFPIIRIVQAADRAEKTKKELPRLILGAVLLILGPASLLDILFDIAGGLIILLSLFYLVFSYLALRKHQNTPGARIFADTDGNGTIDTVYVDTTGDGKADTATEYKEEK